MKSKIFKIDIGSQCMPGQKSVLVRHGRMNKKKEAFHSDHYIVTSLNDIAWAPADESPGISRSDYMISKKHTRVDAWRHKIIEDFES